MKTNRELGFSRIARVGDYEVGRKGKIFRAYGYEWDSDQDASKEQSHHEVCGRGASAEEAIDRMIEAAIIAGPTREYVHNMQTVEGLSRNEAEKLRRELHEALAEIEDEKQITASDTTTIDDALALIRERCDVSPEKIAQMRECIMQSDRTTAATLLTEMIKAIV